MIIITHCDEDGLMSAALMYTLNNNAQDQKNQKRNKTLLFFTSPFLLLKRLLTLAYKNVLKHDLCILDLSPTEKTLCLAALFNSVTWLDHHELTINKMQLDYFAKMFKMNFYLAKFKSNTSLMIKHFNLGFTNIANWLDQIDTNAVQHKQAELFRSIVSAYKHSYAGAVLNTELVALTKKIANNLERIENHGFDWIIDEELQNKIDNFKDWLKLKQQEVMQNVKVEKINSLKLAIVKLKESMPVYAITNCLATHKDAPFDVIVVLTRKPKSIKLEFRTHTNFDVLQLARLFGGGGHKVASGATVKPIHDFFIIFKIKEFLHKLKH